MSYDASVKCKKQDVKGLIHHNAREVDMQNGINLNHSNECIDSDKTMNNRTYFYNQNEKCFEVCKNVQQIYDSLNERLKFPTVDSLEQLVRRITLTLFMNKDTIHHLV